MPSTQEKGAALADGPDRSTSFHTEQNIKCRNNNQADCPRSLMEARAARLVRLYAVNAAMAETLAPLVFVGALR